MALVIDNEANLIVRAPALMPDSVIDEFVRKKRRWINEKQQQVAVFGEKHPPVVVETGESIMYLGSSYAIIKDSVDAVEVSGNELVVPENYDVEALTAWLKRPGNANHIGACCLVCECHGCYARNCKAVRGESTMGFL